MNSQMTVWVAGGKAGAKILVSVFRAWEGKDNGTANLLLLGGALAVWIGWVGRRRSFRVVPAKRQS